MVPCRSAPTAERQGTIADSYSYAPLGNVTSSSGSAPNAFTVEGMSFDHSTGFYFTGSGYYDPTTGQSVGCKDKG